MSIESDRENPCEHGCAKKKWCGVCMFESGNMTKGMETKVIDGYHYIRMRDVSKQISSEKKKAFETGARRERRRIWDSAMKSTWMKDIFPRARFPVVFAPGFDEEEKLWRAYELGISHVVESINQPSKVDPIEYEEHV